MTLLQYEIFNTVIEKGNFTKAGETLGLSQSAVSHAIAVLEAELGFTLMNRRRSGIALTDNGERMLLYMRKILQLAGQMKQDAAAIAGLEIGSLKIGTFASVTVKWLPYMLDIFQKAHPSIHVSLSEGGYEEITQRIATGAVDLGFVILPAYESLDVVSLHDDQMVVLLPEHHPLRKQRLLQIEHIADEPFIMPKSGCDMFVKKLFKEKGVKPKIRFEVTDNEAIIAMVQAGLGVSVLPQLALSQAEKIVVRPFAADARRSIGIAVSSLDTASPAARSFIHIAKKWIDSEKTKCAL